MTAGSHPAWVCGLKHLFSCRMDFGRDVTPCVGVWIETTGSLTKTTAGNVTPCVGVWIETDGEQRLLGKKLSHPAWVCGLKLL